MPPEPSIPIQRPLGSNTPLTQPTVSHRPPSFNIIKFLFILTLSILIALIGGLFFSAVLAGMIFFVLVGSSLEIPFPAAWVVALVLVGLVSLLPILFYLSTWFRFLRVFIIAIIAVIFVLLPLYFSAGVIIKAFQLNKLPR